MKLIRRSHREEQPFWDFAIGRLPDSLTAEVVRTGYGEYRGVKIRHQKYFWGINLGGTVAVIDHNKVSVTEPGYYSTFEKIALEYEAFSGKEVTLEYWED